MKKKTLALVLAAVMALGLVGCGNSDAATSDEAASGKTPGPAPGFCVYPSQSYIEVRQYMETEKVEISHLELIAAQSHCAWKVQRKTIGIISGFENL